MSNVVSNEQMNMLLEEIKRMERSEKKDKSVKTYDFFMPNRFSKERIKALANIFENFSRALSMHLSSMFRIGCTAKVEVVKEKRFREFLYAFGDRDLMGVMDLHDNNMIRGMEKIAIRMPNRFCLFAYVKMLGDSGERAYTDNSLIGRSEMECAVLEHFVETLVPYLNTTWKSFYPVEFSYNSLDNHPKISQIINENNTIVDIQFEVMLSKMKQSLNICIPASFLDDVFEYIDKNAVDSEVISSENNEEHIMNSIEDSKLEIRIVLDNIELTLGDVYNLRTGDIIQLDKHKDEDVQLYIGDAVWFSGMLGTSNNNVAVKINDVLRHFNNYEV